MNPGVPDLSYVPRTGYAETGWLELKADSWDQGGVKLTFQPAQHQWINDHHDKVPVHILAWVGTDYFLFDGKHHMWLTEPRSRSEMVDTALAVFNKLTIKNLQAALFAVTKRARHGY